MPWTLKNDAVKMVEAKGPPREGICRDGPWSRVRKVNGLLVDVSGEHRGTRQKAWIEIKSASSHDYICTGELKTTALSVSRNDGDWCTSPVLFRRPSLAAIMTDSLKKAHAYIH